MVNIHDNSSTSDINDKLENVMREISINNKNNDDLLYSTSEEDNARDLNRELLMKHKKTFCSSSEPAMEDSVIPYVSLDSKGPDTIGDYKMIHSLGIGSTGKVSLAVNNITGDKVAIKAISRQLINETPEYKHSRTNRIYREVLISALLNHPHIVKLLDFKVDATQFYLIFEYVRGKSLTNILERKERLNESECRRYFRQMISALDYIHSNMIAHRDLKLENIMVDEYGNIRILDFGLANYYDSAGKLDTFCGSLYFAAPELLSGHDYQGPDVDVWSLGVVLYVIAIGKMPFEDVTSEGLKTKIRTGELVIQGEISDSLRSLITGMLCKDPRARFTLQEVINSEWVNEEYTIPIESYKPRRYPLVKLHKKYLCALSKVVDDDVFNLEKDILEYFEQCKNRRRKNLCVHKASVCLYYLIHEAIDELNLRNTPWPDLSGSKERVLQNFIEFLYTREKEISFGRYYSAPPLIREDELTSEDDSTDIPEIRSTFFKGFMRGIEIKKIDPEKIRRKLYIFLFQKGISYQIKPKYIICTKGDLIFRISIFLNIIFRKYYLGIKRISGPKGTMKAIIGELSNLVQK
ncbi:putative serine/threonine-protein kinase KIN1 like protein [Astathelohania contejeani]|uniref:Serine/threonine-protein kinase KIN1 like protein n=1 Tax=Astathelohania contejeani TaxID=164912 RepID=A0ABQ7I0W6_9MICR|nr:putative serine/threonine-protein kinase KIN1 like protein [Thelohania contejeani]